MTVQNGDNCANQWKLYEWVERFNGGRTSVDDEHSGLPTTVMCRD